MLRDLDRLQQAEVSPSGKTWKVRTDVGATASALLRACGIAIPPAIQGIPPPAPARPAHPLHRTPGSPPVWCYAPLISRFASQISYLQVRGVEVGQHCITPSPPVQETPHRQHQRPRLPPTPPIEIGDPLGLVHHAAPLLRGGFGAVARVGTPNGPLNTTISAGWSSSAQCADVVETGGHVISGSFNGP